MRRSKNIILSTIKYKLHWMATVPTDVVIVFLAYDGVWQPNVWKLWLEKAAKLPQYSKVHLMVHAPEKTKKEGSFEKAYDINRFPEGDPIRFERTGWCEMSIVIETLKAFQKAYLHMAAMTATATDARVHYYLVSGACIPVKPVRLFFITPYCTVLRKFGENFSHSQWMTLTHMAMKYLLETSIRPGRMLKSNDDVSDTFVETYLMFNCWNGLKKYCPDEYMIGNLLYPLLSKNKALWIDAVTMHQWKVHSGDTFMDSICCDGSPITWKSANKTYSLRDMGSGFTLDKYGVNDELHGSLPTLLLYSRMYPNLDLKASRAQMPTGFFMRKMSRSLPFKTIRKTLDVIYTNEPNIEMVQSLFEKQRLKDLKRPKGDYKETLREETTLPKTPSPPKPEPTSLFARVGISAPLKHVYLNGRDASARALFYQPLRDAAFDILRMEDTLVQGDIQHKDAKLQEFIDTHLKMEGGRGRQRRQRVRTIA